LPSRARLYAAGASGGGSTICIVASHARSVSSAVAVPQRETAAEGRVLKTPCDRLDCRPDARRSQHAIASASARRGRLQTPAAAVVLGPADPRSPIPTLPLDTVTWYLAAARCVSSNTAHGRHTGGNSDTARGVPTSTAWLPVFGATWGCRTGLSGGPVARDGSIGEKVDHRGRMLRRGGDLG